MRNILLGLALTVFFLYSNIQAEVIFNQENVVTNTEILNSHDSSIPFPTSALRDDTDLEPGFPVNAYHSSGSYHAGQAIHTLVMNLDQDPELEIITTGLASGPVYAWNHDGSPVPGFPIYNIGDGAAYLAGGPIAPEGRPGLVVGLWNGEIAVFDGQGVMQPGWPVDASNYIATPPSVAAFSSNGEPGIFIEEEDGQLHGYSISGQNLSGWPASGTGGQERHTPAIGDIDGDGKVEILTCSSATTPGVFLHAYNTDGSIVAGFPVNIEPQGYGAGDAFPVIGQIDDDPEPEIIVANKRNEVRVYSGDGTLEAILPYTGTYYYSTACALADFDGDGQSEIVVQTNNYLNVIKSNGENFPGWPQALGNVTMGNSSPVIGDVDGDNSFDIVITVETSGSNDDGEVRAFHSDGSMLSGFPKVLPLGSGAVPAIADIDLDGRNEIIITGSFWLGYSGYYPKCWVYDLQGNNYGGIAWGQFMHDASHTGNSLLPAPSTVNEGIQHLFPHGDLIAVSPTPGQGRMVISFGNKSSITEPVSIYNISGRLVRVLQPGTEIIWDGCDTAGRSVPVGVYFLRTGKAFGRAVVVR